MMLGTKVAHYEITGRLGEGGMGEVWRARDTQLKRDVALKVLAPALLGDVERTQRMRREAEVLASLTDPHIAAIYGLEEHEGSLVLVLELVEGPTLHDRIQSGPLPWRDAARVARDVARGLEAAHGRGVIHRDLKPANVKLTPEDRVKLLDFGLAKAFDEAAGNADLTSSPTVAPGATAAGMILGTAAYMSPEQARGKPLDKRTDIWSFGCVLFELLAGRKAFVGETVSDTIAAVLQGEPDSEALPSATPALLGRIITRCLQKDASRRYHDISDVRLELEELLEGDEPTDTLATQAASASGTVIAAGRVRGGGWWGWLALAVAVVAIGVLALDSLGPSEEPASSVSTKRLSLKLVEEHPLDMRFISIPDFTISPAGDLVAYRTRHRDGRPLILQPLDGSAPKAVPHSDGAFRPAFSPDGEWVAYVDTGTSRLMRAPVTGGNPVEISGREVVWVVGLTWLDSSTLVFTEGVGDVLHSVDATTGSFTRLTELNSDQGEIGQWWPHVLPGGERILYTRWRTKPSDASLVVFDLRTKEYTEVVTEATSGSYLSSGHLLFSRNGDLVAMPFDVTNLEVLGPPVVVEDNLPVNTGEGDACYAVSGDGTLVWVDDSWLFARRIDSLTSTGELEPIRPELGSYDEAELSPDGTQLAAMIWNSDGSDLWVIDVEGGGRQRLTFDSSCASFAWSPDGREIAYCSIRKGPLDLFLVDVETAESREVLASAQDKNQLCWTPGGESLVFIEYHEGGGAIQILDLATGSVRIFYESDHRVAYPQVSPDGEWLAFYSTRSGEGAVFVTSFPERGPLIEVSRGRGAFPRWSPDGDYIYFWRDYSPWEVPFAGATAGAPKQLPGEREINRLVQHYHVVDRGRFLVVTAEVARPDLGVRVNLGAFLRERAPGR